jgi:hypothetical protein
MKLLLLLVAIYSLIFYQHYKIEKSKVTLPGAETKAGKSYQVDEPVKLQGFGSASFLIRSHNLLSPDHQIARLDYMYDR